ncbi:MAG: YlxR family protein [Chloroflexi bacterium]|nr:YlxR family protein [Chloroflexota bacterium]MBI3731906.1 YlxR family protein [Chloroflexota bacterium]
MKSRLSKARATVLKKKASLKTRPQPQRTCVVCRQTSDKRGLVRIVRTPQHGVQIDERGKVPGRGAYLCHQASCWHQALDGSILAQALNTMLSPEEQQQITNYSTRFMDKPGAITGSSR